MPALPTNVVLLRTLRRGVALKLLALPYASALMAMVLWPKGQHVLSADVARRLGSMLSLAPDAVESFAVAMVVLVLLFIGYLFGWMANAALLVVSGDYGVSQAVRIIVKSKLPMSWQNEKAAEIVATAEKQLAEQRANAKSIGPLRFIVVRGGLVFGTIAFVLVHIVLNLVQSQPIAWANLPWKWCFWFLLGIANSGWSWHEITRTARTEA